MKIRKGFYTVMEVEFKQVGSKPAHPQRGTWKVLGGELSYALKPRVRSSPLRLRLLFTL